jgi:hypothetical protein
MGVAQVGPPLLGVEACTPPGNGQENLCVFVVRGEQGMGSGVSTGFDPLRRGDTAGLSKLHAFSFQFVED